MAPAGQENPLPKDGIPSRLTSEQYGKLKEAWIELYKLMDEAPTNGSGGDDDEPKADGKKGKKDDAPGNDIPKDDAAKERMKAEQELRDAKIALEKYGSKRFLDTLWRFNMMDDPDMGMMKFLRARKYNTSAGVAMLAACMKWRIESDVEKIFTKGDEGMKDAEGFIKQMEMGKSYSQGTDRQGRPVVYIHVAKHKLFDQSAKALEDFVIYQMEAVRCLLTPPVVEKVTIVFDMTGFGLANMDWKCILFIVKCLEAYYPESLNVMITHNAPWIFQGIWKILSPMLDPVVRAKIQMTKDAEDLKVHIDEKHLIKTLGGSSDWTWEYTPVVRGENDLLEDEEGRRRAQAHRNKLTDAYNEVNRKWIHEDDDPQNSDLSLLRTLIKHKIRIQYYELDRYIRGRTVYHRHGNIVGNGLVSFDYPGLANTSEGEWEVRGYPNSRESLLNEIKVLTTMLEERGVEIPELDAAGDDDDDDDAPKKGRRRQASGDEDRPRRSNTGASRRKSTSSRRDRD